MTSVLENATFFSTVKSPIPLLVSERCDSLWSPSFRLTMKPSMMQAKKTPKAVFILLAGFLLGLLVSRSSLQQNAVFSDLASSTIGDNDMPVSSSSSKDDGWKTLTVFYGTREQLPKVSTVDEAKFRNSRFFSQVRQDEVVSQLFRGRRGGYFVDLAANDAVRLSNTYALETYFGWDGICIEPNALYWPGLSHRRCHVVGAVVGGDRDEVDFVFGDTKQGVFGGIVGDKFDNKNASEKWQSWREPRLTVKLEEILRRSKAPEVIDYFSLDVEGAEELVLNEAVLRQYRFKVLSLERPKKTVKTLLALSGYTMLKKLSKWGETLWAHESALQELDLAATGLSVPLPQQVQQV
jgi:Methyltransferase FkbM domain